VESIRPMSREALRRGALHGLRRLPARRQAHEQAPRRRRRRRDRTAGAATLTPGAASISRAPSPSAATPARGSAVADPRVEHRGGCNLRFARVRHDVEAAPTPRSPPRPQRARSRRPGLGASERTRRRKQQPMRTAAPSQLGIAAPGARASPGKNCVRFEALRPCSVITCSRAAAISGSA
jgi:hypothetical protein